MGTNLPAKIRQNPVNMASDYDDMHDIVDEPDMDAPAESDAGEDVQRRTRWWGRHAQKYSFLDVSDKAKAHFIATLEVRCSPCGTRLLIGRWIGNGLMIAPVSATETPYADVEKMARAVRWESQAPDARVGR